MLFIMVGICAGVICSLGDDVAQIGDLDLSCSKHVSMDSSLASSEEQVHDP